MEKVKQKAKEMQETLKKKLLDQEAKLKKSLKILLWSLVRKKNSSMPKFWKWRRLTQLESMMQCQDWKQTKRSK